jgi:hypothetical protein
MSLTLEIARRASKIMRFITSFLRVTLRDVVTMFTFAIVSSNAWAQQRKTSSAGRESLAKHAGQKFLTNPDALGKIGNNREGDLAIGNYRELSGIIGNYRDPIIPGNSDNSQSGKIGSDRECRISVSGIKIIFQIFSQMPDS